MGYTKKGPPEIFDIAVKDCNGDVIWRFKAVEVNLYKMDTDGPQMPSLTIQQATKQEIEDATTIKPIDWPTEE